MNPGGPLLSVTDLRTVFESDAGLVAAVDGVTWSVRRGETMALVGESGCGKSVTALSILGLIPDPPGRVVSGSIRFWNRPDQEPIELSSLTPRQLRRIRGHRIAMVFQEPATSLNPVLTVGEQILETVRLHRGLRRRAARDSALESLRRVGLTDPHLRFHQYPHQLSGGMQQRAMIAMALCCNPALLIADEPTTALDVTLQAQILDLLGRLQAETRMGLLLITHDIGVVAQVADRVCVMYAGRIVEQADVAELFHHPLHPYTQALLACSQRAPAGSRRFRTIAGAVPAGSAYPPGCRFHPRCELSRQRAQAGRRHIHVVHDERAEVTALRRCVHDDPVESGGEPELREARPGHLVACWEVTDADPRPAE